MDFSLEIAILAGGRSSRFGSNKALAPWRGRPLLISVVERLRRLTERIFIIANDPAPYRPLGLPIHPDLYPGGGPLAGLHSALVHARGEALFLLACDMPLVEPRLVAHMARLARRHRWMRIVTVERGGRWEPLHSIYPVHLAREAEGLLKAGQRWGLRRFMAGYRPVVVPEAEAARFCPGLHCLQGANTPEELERLLRVAEAGQSGFSRPHTGRSAGKG